MIFTKTKLEGVYVLTPRVFTDTRGYFFESYSKREFEQNGLHYDFVQDNQSFSSYGTIRGLHFQKGEHAQAKTRARHLRRSIGRRRGHPPQFADLRTTRRRPPLR